MTPMPTQIASQEELEPFARMAYDMQCELRIANDVYRAQL
jgi:hypothetical protein